MENDQVFTFNNLTISGFNTALRLDNGISILNNVIFDSNKLDYRVSKDWGGAILNAATCFCNNCTFINNFAQKGGAIFNGGVLYIDNATSFSNNYAKSNGNTILNVDKGKVYFDNVEINGTTDKVRYVSSYNSLNNGIIAALSIVGSFAAGVVAGLIAGPVVGVAVGAAFGAVAGGLSYKLITDHNFDVHFNRIKWAAICMAVL